MRTLHSRGYWMLTGLAALALVSATDQSAAAAAASGIAELGFSTKDAPFFTSLPPTRVESRRPYRYRITTASSMPREFPAVVAVDVPEWLRFRSRPRGRALLVGRAEPGVYDVILGAKADDGTMTTQAFTITVLSQPPDRPELHPHRAMRSETPVSVTMSCPTPGASIRYTTDGTTPTAIHGMLYEAPLTVTHAVTIEAAAFTEGSVASRPVRGRYSVAPAVETAGVVDADEDRAMFAGEVNPRGERTRVWFEWSPDPDMRPRRRTRPVRLDGGTKPVTVMAEASRLETGETYYYRICARGRGGRAEGNVESLVMDPATLGTLVVNTVEDADSAPAGTLTLREAVERVESGGRIAFDPALNGKTIRLTQVGEEHSVLLGEVFTMGAGGWSYLGYQERDYGPSALYARKDLTLDASALPDGIALEWSAGPGNPARLLAVYGDLTMDNITLSGGHALGVPIDGETSQPYTLARGGALAVWGHARLQRCVIHGNRATGDTNPSRDRGAFGGGIYADVITLEDCVVSGNAVSGYGAAGGGVYSVGGAGGPGDSSIERSSICGNTVAGQHAYGGGVYSDGGGRGNSRDITLRSCTIARNLVQDHPGIDESARAQFYYRGGGFYMSNGSLVAAGCTIVENEVTGHPEVFHSRPNMGGGGVAATIGDAHVVESMEVWHSIIAGNTVNDTPDDLFTGSLIEFFSYGYNLVGVIDFSHILVPIPAWHYLSRRHWPSVGDQEGVAVADILDLNNLVAASDIPSQGADAGTSAVLWYPPRNAAVDAIPPTQYMVSSVRAGYELRPGASDDNFLTLLLEKIEQDYEGVLGEDFSAGFGDVSGIVWGGDAGTWPSDPENIPWISFWHDLDAAIGNRLGAARLGDAFWSTFDNGPFGANVVMSVYTREIGPFTPVVTDQLGRERGDESPGDIGAIETVD